MHIHHFLYDLVVVEQQEERWETSTTDEVTAVVLVTHGHENGSILPRLCHIHDFILYM